MPTNRRSGLHSWGVSPGYTPPQETSLAVGNNILNCLQEPFWQQYRFCLYITFGQCKWTLTGKWAPLLPSAVGKHGIVMFCVGCESNTTSYFSLNISHFPSREAKCSFLYKSNQKRQLKDISLVITILRLFPRDKNMKTSELFFGGH